MEEFERTFLAKYLPEDLEDYESVEIIDKYIPVSAEHPTFRLRKIGNKLELTKKTPLKKGDASQQLEQTIILNQGEYEEVNKLPGKVAHKKRYYYKDSEVDVYQEKLKGLVLIDCEFKNAQEMDKLEIPDYCGKEVTQEKFTAGGMICGKSYEDIEKVLDRFGYEKIFLE